MFLRCKNCGFLFHSSEIIDLDYVHLCSLCEVKSLVILRPDNSSSSQEDIKELELGGES